MANLRSEGTLCDGLGGENMRGVALGNARSIQSEVYVVGERDGDHMLFCAGHTFAPVVGYWPRSDSKND